MSRSGAGTASSAAGSGGRSASLRPLGRTRSGGPAFAAHPPPWHASRKEAQMAVRRLNHAVLYVHGLQRAVDFYRQALGFEVRLEIAGRAAFLRAPGSANDHDLGLFEIGSGHAADQPQVGLYHL